MYKRLTTIIISTTVLVFGLPGAAFASDDGGERTRRTDVIWEGLCVGASLDFSKASERRCARKAAAEEREREREEHADADEDHKKDHGEGHDKDFGEDSVGDHSTDGMDEDADMDDKHWPKDKDGERDEPEGETTVTEGSYAALGDSVAAGLGLESPVPGDGICGRTFDAYAYQVAEQRGLQEINHLACTGATLGDLFTEQGVSGPNLDPQLDGAFASGTPELITVTAGANDVRWQDFLRKCYADTCGTRNDQRIADNLLAVLEAKIEFLFQGIERRSSGPPPEVILTGYYNPLSDNCTEIEPRLTLAEINWLSAQTEALNQTLQDAADQFEFVEFVPVDFEGHDICSDDPWVQTIDDPAPFHPTFEGQQAIAEAIG